MIVGMNHFTILAEDERKTLDFYVGLLGLAQGPRPDLGFPGTWLYAGDSQAVLHVVFGRPIGQNQAIQHPLAQIWVDTQAAELLLPELAGRVGFTVAVASP